MQRNLNMDNSIKGIYIQTFNVFRGTLKNSNLYFDFILAQHTFDLQLNNWGACLCL